MCFAGKTFLIFIIIVALFFSRNPVLAQTQAGESGPAQTEAGKAAFSEILDKVLRQVKEKLSIAGEIILELAGNLFASAGSVIDQKKPFLREEFEKEKEEMLDDLLKIKNEILEKFWEKLKESIKKDNKR